MIVKQIVIHDRGAIEMPPPPSPALAAETPSPSSEPEAPKPTKAALTMLPPETKKTDS